MSSLLRAHFTPTTHCPSTVHRTPRDTLKLDLYWAPHRPSQHNPGTPQLENEVKRLESDLAAAKKRKAELEKAVAQHKATNPDTAGRAAKLAQLNALKARSAEVTSQLAAYRESDPETVEAMRECGRGGVWSEGW